MEDFAFCVFCDCFISHVPDPDAAMQVCDDCSSDDWAEDDGQPDEMQEWHDFDPDCQKKSQVYPLTMPIYMV